MTITTLRIDPLVVPASLDDTDATDFRLFGEWNRLLCDEETGLPELAPDADQMLPSWQDSTDTLSLGFVARDADEAVGMVTVEYPQEAGAATAAIDLLVPSAYAGRGIEEALLAHAEADAARRGRRTLQLWTLHRAQEQERMLTPRTGWGHVPATRLSDVAERAGYVLEQVERNSELPLTGDDTALRSALEEARAAAGPDYRVVAWMLPTPVELRAGYAAVLAKLATDAPSGELTIDDEDWDAERVARRDGRLTAAGQAVSVVAVEHVPTGELVAYNELLIGADRSRVTHQFGTLVAREHRGKKLGTIVKCENLLRWRDIAPASPAVSTFNAEENRPMLDINESIGFVPVSYAGAWQKSL